MKTIVSKITGRKDYPVFDTEDEDLILDYLKKRDWSSYTVYENSEGFIDIDDGDFGGDTLEIIDVEVVKLEETVSKSSIVLDNLSEEKQALINKAVDEITIEKLNSLDYGEEMELVDGVTLSHYCEDEIVVVNLTEEWTEVLQVQWDTDSGEIVYEAL